MFNSCLISWSSDRGHPVVQGIASGHHRLSAIDLNGGPKVKVTPYARRRAIKATGGYKTHCAKQDRTLTQLVYMSALVERFPLSAS